MSLKAFHIFFILMSILISWGFSGWVFALAPSSQASAGLSFMGAFSGILGVGLAVYCVFFVRKAKHIIV